MNEKLGIKMLSLCFALLMLVFACAGCKSGEEKDVDNASVVQTALENAVTDYKNGNTEKYDNMTLKQFASQNGLVLDVVTDKSEMFWSTETHEVKISKLYPDKTYLLLKEFEDEPVSTILKKG